MYEELEWNEIRSRFRTIPGYKFHLVAAKAIRIIGFDERKTKLF